MSTWQASKIKSKCEQEFQVHLNINIYIKIYTVGFREAGYQPREHDLAFIEQENGFDQAIPLYVNEASGFIDEEISITNAKEVYSCLVQFLEESQVCIW